MNCPCGKPTQFSQCCGAIIEGRKVATSPEQLMRSRYSAFVVKNIDYLVQSTDPQTRHLFDSKANEEWARSVSFTQLEIIKSLVLGNRGQVEFIAHYTNSNGTHIHHEFSTFIKRQSLWFFKEGKALK